MKALARAFGRANRSETVHMVLRKPSSPDFYLFCLPFFFFFCGAAITPPTTPRPSLIRNRTAYLAAAIVTEVAVPGGLH